ncbi:hypothetical protein GGQ68_002527 [Sagittula marina]|uniref:Uncharacterized protein n=1 Tax=Sagittula marina TaxID=943940 RepID=A0A7W6DVS6_9RHOB|nr:hypothetical protein [Sagittula marina]MBB3986189.1 hypothetical protein [Sagittula marina]
MTRAAIICGALALVIAATFWAGLRWNAGQADRDRIRTLETVDQLEKDARNATDDDLADSLSDPVPSSGGLW